MINIKYKAKGVPFQKLAEKQYFVIDKVLYQKNTSQFVNVSGEVCNAIEFNILANGTLATRLIHFNATQQYNCIPVKLTHCEIDVEQL